MISEVRVTTAVIAYNLKMERSLAAKKTTSSRLMTCMKKTKKVSYKEKLVSMKLGVKNNDVAAPSKPIRASGAVTGLQGASLEFFYRASRPAPAGGRGRSRPLVVCT